MKKYFIFFILPLSLCADINMNNPYLQGKISAKNEATKFLESKIDSTFSTQIDETNLETCESFLIGKIRMYYHIKNSIDSMQEFN